MCGVRDSERGSRERNIPSGWESFRSTTIVLITSAARATWRRSNPRWCVRRQKSPYSAIERIFGLERMQAITGPWPSLIRDIQDDLFDEDGFEGHLDWGHARGRDFQCLTSIVYLIDKPSAAFPGAQQLEKWLQDNDPVPVKFRNEIFDTFRVYVELARKFNSTFHKPTKLAPIEFVMIGLLVHMYRMKLSLTQLSSAIEKMRADVRGKYIDIRQNSKVTKTMLEFIKKRVKISELKSDKQGDKPVSSKARQTKTSAASKRKRAVYSDDESSEIDALKPPPSKSRATAGSSKAPTASSSGKLYVVPKRLLIQKPLFPLQLRRPSQNQRHQPN